MRPTRRLRLAALVAAAVAAFLTSPIGGTVLTGCPNGTNWDNITHTCR